MGQDRHRGQAVGGADDPMRSGLPAWTTADVEVLRQWYAARAGGKLELDKLATQLGRLPSNICRKARTLGLTDHRRTSGRKDKRKFKGDNEEARRSIGRKVRERIATKGHPRGMLGKKQTPESVAKSVAGVKNWRALQSTQTLREIAERSVQSRIKKYGRAVPLPTQNAYSRARRGYRDDLGKIFFRSRWEANYARFLNLLKANGEIRAWEYEADTFWFEAIRRGIRSYTPDFKVRDRSGATYYVEVKGWMDPKSKTKLKRMKKYYPAIDLRLFGEKAYRELDRKLGKAIAGWE